MAWLAGQIVQPFPAFNAGQLMNNLISSLVNRYGHWDNVPQELKDQLSGYFEEGVGWVDGPLGQASQIDALMQAMYEKIHSGDLALAGTPDYAGGIGGDHFNDPYNLLPVEARRPAYHVPEVETAVENWRDREESGSGDGGGQAFFSVPVDSGVADIGTKDHEALIAEILQIGRGDAPSGFVSYKSLVLAMADPGLWSTFAQSEPSRQRLEKLQLWGWKVEVSGSLDEEGPYYEIDKGSMTIRIAEQAHDRPWYRPWWDYRDLTDIEKAAALEKAMSHIETEIGPPTVWTDSLSNAHSKNASGTFLFEAYGDAMRLKNEFLGHVSDELKIQLAISSMGALGVAIHRADDIIDVGQKVRQWRLNSHLRKPIGDPPKGIKDPHAHHILFKKGLGPAQQKLVAEGQEILRKVGIDPIWGHENLVWAPWKVTGQHDIAALTIVIKRLRELDKAGAEYDDFVKALKELGKIAAKRK